MHRLLVLPHAGGAAHGYLPLRQALEPAVPVLCHELPGRGKRSREAKAKNLNSAVDDILQASAELRQGTWSVFGHSMGALLAHALVRRLLELGQALPQGIYASGTMAPSARQRKSISQLPRDDFWREIRAYGGVPAEILAVPDFMDYFEGILRDDFRLLEEALPPPSPVPVPVTVLYGTDEMTLTQAESWTAETTRPVVIHGFSGHHFFLSTQFAAVAKVIRDGMAAS
ncbi:alpha/beta fold hydrolase [Pseudoroseomonas wenyumeiae]|uniref:Alpha/beta fold hydrolase n=1 Tax=Teichococcus wenyumeiae TaxID=2478470 RepID=A0A3A9J755_9PROT|nr:alpha/beta fold hydrolase [Pseudoroseomonas wenyumeiae]RKK02292.1 thioesterase [Pseudoroseomonas wenyumeiae]RMI17553.1 alpha/beta fold hydrolase [Pseudoroseomonas wenyumeiae]